MFPGSEEEANSTVALHIFKW